MRAHLNFSDDVLGALWEIVANPPADAPAARTTLREQLRAINAGHYVADAIECQTRRVDLNAPTDEDPGPLPMEEASEHDEAVWLSFAGESALA